MNKNSEAGFSYIDVMIAIVILMVGILALMAGLSASVLMAKGQDQQMRARQITSSTMESIMSVKETSSARLGWDAVGNIGTNPKDGIPGNPLQGVFLVGDQDVLPDAGTDQIIGTADDAGTALQQMRRQITITDQCDPDRPSANCPTPGPNKVRLRSVQVIVTYFVGGLPRTEQLTTVLSDYEVK